MALSDQSGLGEACMIPSLAPACGYLAIQHQSDNMSGSESV